MRTRIEILAPSKSTGFMKMKKRRKYNSRVTEIEQGTFTPLVFTTTGGMADECLRHHEGKVLREEIAVFTRNLLKIAYHPSLLEGYTSCRLIPLDKNPGIRPIGVGEVLRRIVGKNVSGFLKEEIKETAGPFQVCAGHSADSETVIHAMSQVFVEEGTDGILPIDAGNAFNQMNRSVTLHYIRITCKEMSLYIINTYRSPSRLFICG